jgi:hypothetical protein
MTSVSVTTGANSLISVGVSLGDIAVIVRHARRLGSWLTTSILDQELFESIADISSSLLRRKGLVDVTAMQSRWSSIDFIYQGSSINKSARTPLKDQQHLSDFSWLMIVVIAALDVCLAPVATSNFIVDLFVSLLGDDHGLGESLIVQIPTNVESWRSAGRVRRISTVVASAVQECRFELSGEKAVPQLNKAESEEMQAFLSWLMAGDTNDLDIFSPSVYAVAYSLGKKQAGLHLGTHGKRLYESEPVVSFVREARITGVFLGTQIADDSLGVRRVLYNRVQQVAYPKDCPQYMIDTVPVTRPVTNIMTEMWSRGEKAAESMKLSPTANSELTRDSDVEYVLESSLATTKRFDAMLSMLAHHGFPTASDDILLALEHLTNGCDRQTLEWLHSHTALEYLQHESSNPCPEQKKMDLWTEYQALVFGFYYGLLRPLVSTELISKDAYFRGIWGYGSTRFLAMCSKFGESLDRDGRVTRTHVLRLLAAMYDGRQSVYSTKNSSGLVGILGTVSILTMSLLRTTDQPDQIGKFVLVDLPVIDLVSETNGELYCGTGSGIDFIITEKVAKDVLPHGPNKEWSVHAKMGVLVGQGETGVLMAARCGGRLVGWFSPLIADIVFLNTSFIIERHVDEEGYEDLGMVKGFEVIDRDWQDGRVQRPLKSNASDHFGVVHSRGCAALRYAAAGMYFAAREEVAIATDDITAAFSRVELQETGVIIA